MQLKRLKNFGHLNVLFVKLKRFLMPISLQLNLVLLVIPVSSRSQLSKRISSQETLKKCLLFVEDVFFKISKKHTLNSEKTLWFSFRSDVFFKISKKHTLNSEKTLWFSFRSDSNDVAKKLASCGFCFTKNQFHLNWDLKSLMSEMV